MCLLQLPWLKLKSSDGDKLLPESRMSIRMEKTLLLTDTCKLNEFDNVDLYLRHIGFVSTIPNFTKKKIITICDLLRYIDDNEISKSMVMCVRC